MKLFQLVGVLELVVLKVLQLSFEDDAHYVLDDCRNQDISPQLAVRRELGLSRVGPGIRNRDNCE